MRISTEAQLQAVLRAVPGPPRVVMSGNFASPRAVLALLDAMVPEYRLFALNAQAGVPDRPGATMDHSGDGNRD
jgi:hypothetical protein